MKKELGPMAKLHDGPYNKVAGNGINGQGPEAISKIAQNGGEVTVPKKAAKSKLAFKEEKKPIKPSYALSQRIDKSTGDTTSFEMIPGPKKWVDDDTFGRVQMSTLKSNPISNEEYRRRMDLQKKKKNDPPKFDLSL